MDGFREGLAAAWANIAFFLPKLVAFIAILVVGFLIARLLERLTDRVLERVGFDRWVERGGVRRALARSRFDASSLVAKIVFALVGLFVLQLAFGLFGDNPVSELIQGIIAYLPNVLAAILIVVVGAAIAAVVRDVVLAAIGGLEYGLTVARVAGGAVMVITVFAALDQLRIAPTVVNGLFYALLAIVVGSAIVAFGGGGIPVARRYLDRWSGRLDQESERIREEARGTSMRLEEQARLREAQLTAEQPVATTPATAAAATTAMPTAPTTTAPTPVIDVREPQYADQPGVNLAPDQTQQM